MLYWDKYISHNPEILGKRKKFDNTIYTFDIETTSYLVLNGKQIPAVNYEKLSKNEQEECKKCSCMYIWMFSINDTVYYGRTWKELKEFMKRIDDNVPYNKTIFIHNASFEFQYMKSNFNIKNVMARKARKVISSELLDYRFTIRCTYMMSNSSLDGLSGLFKLPIKKLVGNLNYDLLRHSETPLSEKELSYCENDCLVLYHYIRYELETYENINKIPSTSTGHVRKELKDLIQNDYKYKRIVSKAVNTNPHIYNLLQQAFQGGITHSNWIYTDEVLENIDSWDFTSSYPYVMVTHKYPSTEFKQCFIKSVENMSRKLAYLLVVKFTNVKSKYFNNIISQSKCRNIYGGKYDNGRIMEADSFEMTLTDIDFYLILEAYDCDYEIIECYYSMYNYLPKQFINFVLEKYVLKTQYKNVADKEVEYSKEKSKFNSLYG